MLKWLYSCYSMSDTAEKYRPSIQERIAERVREIVVPIEDWLERLITMPDRFNPETFQLIDHFKKEKVGGVHARKIIEMYETQYKEYKDLLELRKKNLKFKEIDEEGEGDSEERQLLESYEDISNEVIEKGIKAHDNIFKACDYMIDIANANRKPRKKKPISKDKLVSKLQYSKEDTKYNLKSIDPKDIITAEQLWVFNTKTRKLGIYVASVLDPRGLNREGTGLSVKGTSVQGFDPEKSVQKTLRKPEEQLSEFMKCGPVKSKTFFSEIKSMEIALTGRINPDTILLKV
jgi:hypothetical protein